MEEKMQTENPEEISEEIPENQGYVPRPRWQIIGAWVGVVVMLCFLALAMMEMVLGGGK